MRILPRRRDRRGRLRWLPLLAALASGWLGGSAEPASAQGPVPDVSGASLEPGDAVGLAFWREPALTGEYPVDETGSVVLPYVGARSVIGVAPATLRQRLLDEYAGVLANQGVHVSLLRRVRILGAVRAPGLYRVDGTMTIADALALAGGLTPDGRLSGVRIVRDGQVIPVDLTSEITVDQALHSGDQITVAESGWLSRNSAALTGATISAIGFLLGQAIF